MLLPLEGSVLPDLPEHGDGSWSARTTRWWNGIRQDPATALFGAGEIEQAIDLGYLFEENVREPKGALATEARLRLDGLGLTPKGKRDLRLRVEPDDRTGRSDSPPSTRDRFRVGNSAARRERLTAKDRMEEVRRRAGDTER
jgi:hypothetical protein